MRSAWREAQVVGTGQVVSKLGPCPGLPIEAPGGGCRKHTFNRPLPDLAGRGLGLLHLFTFYRSVITGKCVPFRYGWETEHTPGTSTHSKSLSVASCQEPRHAPWSLPPRFQG